MITPDAAFFWEEDSKISYNTELATAFRYHPLIGGGQFLCQLIAIGDALDIQTYVAELNLVIDATAVDAKSAFASGVELRDKLLSAVELCIVDYLEGITNNKGITFTISR